MILKIIRESYKVLIISAILSIFGGISLRSIKSSIFTIIPLLIIFPALNDLIGDFSTIISSKFTTYLYLGKINEKKIWTKEMKKLLKLILYVSFFSTIYLIIFSIIVLYFNKKIFELNIWIKIFFISFLTVIFLILILFLISLNLGIYVYKKGMDPDNFLIPISTAIADFFTLLLFAVLIIIIKP